jgi:hypothetical protein
MKEQTKTRDNIRRILYDNNINILDEKTNKRIFNYSSGSVINHNDDYWIIKGAKIFHNMDLQNKFFKKLPNKIELGFLEFKRMGFILVSVQLIRNEKWFKDQLVAYVIMSKDDDLDPSFNILTGIPDGHKLLYDPKEKRLRIWGKNAGPTGLGPWIDIKR